MWPNAKHHKWYNNTIERLCVGVVYIYIYIYIRINKCIYYKFSDICFHVLQKDQVYEDGGEFFEIYNQHMVIACSAWKIIVTGKINQENQCVYLGVDRQKFISTAVII